MSKEDKVTNLQKLQKQKEKKPKLARQERKERLRKVAKYTARAVVYILILAIVFIAGRKSMQKEANDKVELLSQKIMAEAPTIYLEKLNLQLEFIKELKEYRQWITDNNSDGTIFTIYIDGMIRDHISDAESEIKEKEIEEIIPELDYTKVLINANDYFGKYVKELEKVVDTYQYSYPVNRRIESRLTTIQENYSSKINSAEILEAIFELEEKCQENMKFWDEIGELD